MAELHYEELLAVLALILSIHVAYKQQLTASVIH